MEVDGIRHRRRPRDFEEDMVGSFVIIHRS